MSEHKFVSYYIKNRIVFQQMVQITKFVVFIYIFPLLLFWCFHLYLRIEICYLSSEIKLILSFLISKATFSPQHIFQDDCHHGFSFGMETINAVNFEDLFDFSPEPVDRLSHDDRELQPSPLTIPPTQAPPNSYVSPSSSGRL